MWRGSGPTPDQSSLSQPSMYLLLNKKMMVYRQTCNLQSRCPTHAWCYRWLTLRTPSSVNLIQGKTVQSLKRRPKLTWRVYFRSSVRLGHSPLTKERSQSSTSFQPHPTATPNHLSAPYSGRERSRLIWRTTLFHLKCYHLSKKSRWAKNWNSKKHTRLSQDSSEANLRARVW